MEQNMEKYAGYQQRTYEETNQGANMQYSGANQSTMNGQYSRPDMRVQPATSVGQNGGGSMPSKVNLNPDVNGAEYLLKKLKKEMLINRIISCVTLAMTTAILVLVIIGFVEIKSFLDTVEPVVEELSKIDMEALNESLNNFNNIIETFNIDELMDTLNAIDFEGINEVLNGLDVEELTETLENINEGADRLDEISEWFENSPFNIFGIGGQ